MFIDPPHYHEFFPNMSKLKWKSNSNWDLGWISGLYSVSTSSLHSIYGDFDAFQLNPSEPLNFSGLDFDHFVKDSHGPITYLSFWALVIFLFIISLYCWCYCNNWCCFICVVAKAQPNEPIYDSEGKETGSRRKISVSSIVLAVLMGLWLIIFIILIRHTFATNSQTNEAVTSIHTEMNKTIRDIDLYLETTRRQIKYTFQTCFWTLRDKIDHVLKQCTGTGCEFASDKLSEIVRKSLDTTSEYVIKHSTELGIALANVQAKIIKAEKETKEKFEDTLVDVNTGMYSFFMCFNLLYCLVFVMVLVGTVFVTFGPGVCLKTAGLLALRCSIVAMFMLGIAVVFQLATMFVAAGVASEIICPAIRRLERIPDNSRIVTHSMQKRFIPGGSEFMKINAYKVPEFGIILRGCKEDQSAYKAFDLRQAYDVRNINNLTDTYFNIDISGILSRVINHLQTHINLNSPLIAQTMKQLNPNQLQRLGGGVMNGQLMETISRNPSLLNTLPDMNPNQLTQLAAANRHLGGSIPDSISQIQNNIPLNTLNSVAGSSSLLNQLPKMKLPWNKKNRRETAENNSLPHITLNPVETVEEIKSQIKHYTNFVVESIEGDLGKCKPAYDAINATLGLFCDRIAAPVKSFWWILQFIPPTFILIIVTAIWIVKVH